MWNDDDDDNDDCGALAPNDAAPRNHFCSVHMSLASDSQFVKAGVKEKQRSF
jgi:hypothetical protein